MPEHEYYEQLSSLPTADLSQTEQEEVQAHIATCPSCAAARRQTRRFTRDILPLADNGRGHFFNMLRHRDAAAECREIFVQQARARGVTLSDAARRGSRMGSVWPPLSLTLAFRAAAIALLMLIALLAGERWGRANRPISVAPVAEVRVSSNAGLTAQIASLQDQVRTLAGDLERQSAETQEAVNDKAASQAAFAALDASDRDLRRRVADLEQSLALSENGRKDVQAQLQTEMQVAAAARSESEAVRAARAKDQATLVAQAAELQDLSRSAKLAQANLDREQELLDAGRDIRDLMGARNLHILDVNDYDTKGNRKNAFGRIFYTEGKSLIFYAYDLSSPSAKNASFQAWGHNEADRSVTNLGVLYMDDQKQSRWVLKINDPEVLAHIDSVFVTVERPGGSKQPNGDKRLYAYLGHAANHP